MRFEEIEYERLDLKKVKKELCKLEKEYRKAKTYEEAKKIDAKIKEYMANTLYTTTAFVHIKNTIDTSDKFYEDELKYYNKKMSMFLKVSKKLSHDIAYSPFRENYIKDGHEIDIKINEASIKQQSLKTVLLKIKESNLQMEYSKAVAQAKTTFNGKELNFYGLLKEMQDKDRNVRKEALKAWSDLYESISGKLDEIYIELIKNRKAQAKKLGYEDYVEQIYASRNIFDYNRFDVANFKDNVVKYVVPACEKLRAKQAARLGVDHLYYYDESLFYPEGAMVPKGSTEELIEKAYEMYQDLSKETGEYFKFMKEANFFDLETKPNKRGGGYCSALPKYKAPFIFSNFNGTSADVDVLTHEAGHGFAAYTAFHKDSDQYAQDNMTMDIAEVHSMSMELFTYPYMEKFFGEDADKYRYSHFEEALMTIPYLCAVDEFQHQVFKLEEATSADFKRIWHDIEKRFLPWRDYGEENKFLCDGGFWMQKQHIFLFPFYYVDYALSQICAFQFFEKETKNHEVAWHDYYKLCKIAGMQGYFDTLKAVNLKSPFEEETIKNVVSFVMEYSKQLEAKVNNK